MLKMPNQIHSPAIREQEGILNGQKGYGARGTDRKCRSRPVAFQQHHAEQEDRAARPANLAYLSGEGSKERDRGQEKTESRQPFSVASGFEAGSEDFLAEAAERTTSHLTSEKEKAPMPQGCPA